MKLLNEAELPEKIEWYGNVKVKEHIVGFLQERQLNLFRASVFGKFLDIKNYSVSGSFLKALFLRQYSTDEVDCLMFYVRGEHCRFGLLELSLITGLKTSKYVCHSGCENKRSELLRQYCNGNEVSVAELYSLMLREREHFKEEENDRDAVKFAQVYLLASFLLGIRKVYKIPEVYFCMVEDDYVLDNYCWGNLIFDTIRKDLKDWGLKSEPLVYTSAFALALQFWACEVFPFLMPRPTNSDHSVPRILKWQGLANAHFTKRRNEFLGLRNEEYPAYERMVREQNEDVISIDSDDQAQMFQIGSSQQEIVLRSTKCISSPPQVKPLNKKRKIVFNDDFVDHVHQPSQSTDGDVVRLSQSSPATSNLGGQSIDGAAVRVHRSSQLSQSTDGYATRVRRLSQTVNLVSNRVGQSYKSHHVNNHGASYKKLEKMIEMNQNENRKKFGSLSKKIDAVGKKVDSFYEKLDDLKKLLELVIRNQNKIDGADIHVDGLNKPFAERCNDDLTETAN